MNNVQQTVTAGVAYMDEARPGWLDAIGLETLRMSDCRDCILGQAYENFTIGAMTLTPQRMEALGFLAHSARDYAALTAEWKRQIKTKRSEAQP